MDVTKSNDYIANLSILLYLKPTMIWMSWFNELMIMTIINLKSDKYTFLLMP